MTLIERKDNLKNKLSIIEIDLESAEESLSIAQKEHDTANQARNTLLQRKEAIGKEIKMIEDIELYLENLESNQEGEMNK